MATYDIIEAALTAPIDWGVFEKLVVEILAQDDMPRLRRAGGYKDSGVDAYEAAIYSDERTAQTVVQITSQRAQSLKVETTLQRIKSVGLSPQAITFVFRHPVSSAVRANIAVQCGAAAIQCDVRDQTYLMLQLGKNTTGLFARYFETFKAQFVALLSTPDPLAAVSDRTKHAMLLSVAAFIMHPRARLVRQALFQRTTAAALVSRGQATESDLVAEVKQLMPEEDISVARITVALSELEKNGDASRHDGQWKPTDACLARFGAVLGGVRSAYDQMTKAVLTGCSRACGSDQASLGVIERNLRRALMRLLRMAGPLGSDDKELPFLGISSLPEVRACLSQDLNDNVARCLIASFAGYIEDPENITSLALFARSYSALALRNLDPVGRRWQQMALQRSVIALDTDALLTLLIKELPEHSALLKAIVGIVREGARIVISPEVLLEASGHISRADRTFRRCGSQLERMSPAMVDAVVWHAVVRGYYYARKAEYAGTWKTYWSGYYDERNPDEFLRFQLTKLPNCRVEDLSGIPGEWLTDLEELTNYIVEKKESHRYKAEFREPDQMVDRVRMDLRMALHLADHAPEEGIMSPGGYLASEDRAFFKAERHPAWGQRRRVAVLTRSLTQLADFACGAQLADDEVVRLLYEPILAAAAESLSLEIDTLTTLGINLRTISLSRLEWALQNDLRDEIHAFCQDHHAEGKLDAGVRLVHLAAAKGLPVDTFVDELARGYDAAKKSADASATGEEAATERLKRVVLALAKTKKSRRRANRVLREFGLSLSQLQDDDNDDSGTQECG